MVKDVVECPVFHPTLEDMNGPFEMYMDKIEKRIAKAGIGKIVAPAGWTPRRGGYDDVNVRIERCIKQVATGTRGLYRFLLVEQKPMMSKDDFMPMAMAAENQPGTSDFAELERKYWKNISLFAMQNGDKSRSCTNVTSQPKIEVWTPSSESTKTCIVLKCLLATHLCQLTFEEPKKFRRGERRR